MKIKSVIGLFILFNVLSLTSLAQAPGYMGKRFSMGYGFYTSPAVYGSGGENILNMLHEAYFERVVKKRVSFGFSARFYKAISDNHREVRIASSQSNQHQLDSHPSDVTKITGQNYLMYFKFFHQNYVAPWGRYFIIGLTINAYKATYDPNKMIIRFGGYQGYYPNYNYTTSNFSKFGPVEQSDLKIDLLLGFGRSRIVSKRVIIDYGYNVNLVALALTLNDVLIDQTGNSDISANDYIEMNSADRVRGVNRFNVFCKVGFLLF